MSPKPALLVLALSIVAAAQEPSPPATTGTPPSAASEVLRRAFVDASADRPAIHAAANQLQKGDADGRARFMATLHAVAAAAAAADAGDAAKPGPATDKPAEFADDVRGLMADVAVGSPQQREAALAKLGALPDVGVQAITRLHERGRSILQRCVQSFLRLKMATNALYAGQFDELKDFQPEAGAILLGWAKTAPKDASPTGAFRAACLRALRDIEAADQANDTLREDLRAIARQAERASDENLFVTAVCALHQFGDPSLFDELRHSIEQRVNTEDAQQKLAATNTLADLNYQLRDYAAAAKHFQAAVEMLEQTGQAPATVSSTSYNAACSLALAGKTDEAFSYLEKALQNGARSRQLSKAMLDEDHDTNSLRTDPRFAKLMERFFGTAGRPGK